MKLKNIIQTTLLTIVLTSCYTSSRISKFSSENINLGIDKNLFIKRYGKRKTTVVIRVKSAVKVRSFGKRDYICK